MPSCPFEPGHIRLRGVPGETMIPRETRSLFSTTTTSTLFPLLPRALNLSSSPPRLSGKKLVFIFSAKRRMNYPSPTTPTSQEKPLRPAQLQPNKKHQTQAQPASLNQKTISFFFFHPNYIPGPASHRYKRIRKNKGKINNEWRLATQNPASDTNPTVGNASSRPSYSKKKKTANRTNQPVVTNPTQHTDQ